MPFNNLPHYLEQVDKIGLLHRIKVEVDPCLEITEILNRFIKEHGGNPVLLFENVKGSEFPLVIHLFGSDHLMKFALGITSYEEVAKKLQH